MEVACLFEPTPKRAACGFANSNLERSIHDADATRVPGLPGPGSRSGALGRARQCGRQEGQPVEAHPLVRGFHGVVKREAAVISENLKGAPDEDKIKRAQTGGVM